MKFWKLWRKQVRTRPSKAELEFLMELDKHFPNFKSDWQNEPNWMYDYSMLVVADFMRYFRDLYFQSQHSKHTATLKNRLTAISHLINRYLKNDDKDVQELVALGFLEVLHQTEDKREDYNAMTNILGGEAKRIIEEYYPYPERKAEK